MIEVGILNLGVESESEAPVVLLRAEGEDRVLPIWIGQPEATAIMLVMQGIEPPRPLTHDLLLNLVRSMGFDVERVEINDLDDGTFFADLVLTDGTNTVTVDARPSDSIAVALRAGAPILVDEKVMAEAGRIYRDGALSIPGEGPDADNEVAAFRDFLDHIEPEDFASNS
jgi:bifunctional DNase/RNase